MKCNYKHGLSYQKEYLIFNTIRARCYSKKDHNYKYYGARGISIWKNWIGDPKAFIDYIKLLPYYGTPTYSLDRIDNDGNYVPGNLRWASKRVQVLNRRKYHRSRNYTAITTNNNTSGYTGVVWCKDKKKWKSIIGFNRVRYYLGSFKNIESAVNARNNFIVENNLEYYNVQPFKKKV